jgi:hypothetical protein
MSPILDHYVQHARLDKNRESYLIRRDDLRKIQQEVNVNEKALQEKLFKAQNEINELKARLSRYER